ncbi:caspase domain-containing protein [Lasiosphaeria miniovina]|uniref:Caspase domain-containing protein n=1 Tax=Lasiosphaeria miniovina TaxID=1954250 RepID=A0AA39ZU27_9PEZI|nr:caspase domain-containing protein [Lasiosphaeria miniovina]KAK0703663.1 caspase domain-containing protein [Lasiosphaeria miniovina]
MNPQGPVISRFAILIGINAYPDRPLQGCVRDILAFERYLQQVSSNTHIQLFTAASSLNPSPSPSPGLAETFADPSTLPTYRNVTLGLEKVTLAAQPGDLVYIHFSGHGTRCEPYAEFSNQSTGDLALVLLSGKKNDEIFLRGPRLARALNAMVEKGLVVTVVLDCCFSGSVYRRDNPRVRFLPCDSVLDQVEIDADEDDKTGELEAIIDSGNRDASARVNWLINPAGYSILAACCPHEEALESEFDGQPRGVLSYLLLQVLQEHGGLGTRFQDIYASLQAKFKARDASQQQNPVLYGNKRQGFFGKTYSDTTTAVTAVPIVRGPDGSLQLQAGQAHGVSCGDRFTLYPVSKTGDNNDSSFAGNQALSKAIKVRALTSQLEHVDDAAPTTTHGPTETGWLARPLNRRSLEKFSIQLSPDILPREEWLTAMRGRHLGIVHGESDGPSTAASFRVDLNRNEEYEIRDQSGQKLINLPLMLQSQTETNYFCDVMEHLAKFALVGQLTDNSSTSMEKEPDERAIEPFAKSFSVQITTRSGAIVDAGCPVQVDHSEKLWTFELQVENKGDKALYLYAYNMGPLWQVEGIDFGTYQLVPPRDDDQKLSGVVKKRLRTMVPPKMLADGYRQCEDIIKVFVTSQPTSFDILELPEIGEVAPEKKSSSRISWADHDVLAKWAALSFPIHTFFSSTT